MRSFIHTADSFWGIAIFLCLAVHATEFRSNLVHHREHEGDPGRRRRVELWNRTSLSELAESLDCHPRQTVAQAIPVGYPERARLNLTFDGFTIPIAAHQGDHITNAIKRRGWYGDLGAFRTVRKKMPRGGGGQIMLDVGANIGVFTLYAAAAGWPVIAVEASEANAMRLQESLTMNNFHNVTLFKMAAGAAIACHAMAIGWKPHNFGMNSFVVKNVPTDKTQNTLVVPLNTVIDPAVTIAFFKLDVEGFECEALKGARDLFRRKQVRTIFVELNEPLLLKGGCSLDGLKSLLAGLCVVNVLSCERTDL